MVNRFCKKCGKRVYPNCGEKPPYRCERCGKDLCATEVRYPRDKFVECLKGKTIVDGEITGFGAELVFEDGDVLYYDATDGGYSSAWLENKMGRIYD